MGGTRSSGTSGAGVGGAPAAIVNPRVAELRSQLSDYERRYTEAVMSNEPSTFSMSSMLASSISTLRRQIAEEEARGS